MDRGVAVVTGASSGIGAATARRLATEGFEVVVGARRLDRLEALAADIGAKAYRLDVTERSSVDDFVAQVTSCRVLVNNAGGALGLDPIADAREADWAWMYDANVLGVLRMTQALLPQLEASGNGHVVNVGSIAGFDPYPGGGGYNAAKFGLTALTRVLRMELVARPIHVTEIDPGMVETEFSVVRFEGDADRAASVYAGITPLTADDVADCIAFAVTRPPHVNIDQIVVKPRAQATATLAHRSS
jgi:NADP-dependent 3-hydroxy acid dehydrogenase YdfG